MNIYPNLILEALTEIHYPAEKQNIVESGMVEDDIRIDGNKVSFSLISPKQNSPFMKSVVKASIAAIKRHAGDDCEVTISVKNRETQPKPVKSSPIEAAKIVAISSGKGGVGKSTVSSNLAVALAKQGYSVGLLDADIFGPSIPKMFGVEDYRPELAIVGDRNLMQPAEKFGVKLLSIGFFVDPNNAVVWRGMMAGNAIKQLVEEANWGKLDYFLVDLPPGTSDIHLTIVDVLKFTGAIIVSTPQSVAIADVIKGIEMFENPKINVPILGLVENMAYFTPEELPDNKYYIFGREGVKRFAEERGVPLLAQIPVIQSICESSDDGTPEVLKNPLLEEKYLEIIEKI
ncbi:MAG: Mrp/NBP35 family ATP-binding protein [Porphyromonadaceae bacterium]|nr:Mrp/NBP35 family ATP-binding protein [Porphyromonadaceae bacterium]